MIALCYPILAVFEPCQEERKFFVMGNCFSTDFCLHFPTSSVKGILTVKGTSTNPPTVHVKVVITLLTRNIEGLLLIETAKET